MGFWTRITSPSGWLPNLYLLEKGGVEGRFELFFRMRHIKGNL